MIIPNWLEAPTGNVFIRSTPVYHGGIITSSGMIPGSPEYSSRRYSVIDLTGAKPKLSIGSVAYKSNYRSEDVFEVHRRYLMGEWDDLLIRTPDITAEVAKTWTGEALTISSFYN